MKKKLKNQKDSKLQTWITIILVLLGFVAIAALKNYTWLKEQNRKPFGQVDKPIY